MNYSTVFCSTFTDQKYFHTKILVEYQHRQSSIWRGSDHCACVTGSDVTGSGPDRKWRQSHDRKWRHNRKYVLCMRNRYILYYYYRCSTVVQVPWLSEVTEGGSLGWGVRMRNRQLRNIRPSGAFHRKWRHQAKFEMFYITNQSHHWKLNQSEEGCLLLRPRSNYIYSERIVIDILDFLTDHDHVHLREMRQRIYREEQPDQASKDSCRCFTDLFLWGMRKRVQPTRPQKEAWSGPQLQLDLRCMRSVFQQTGQPSTPSSPAWETRGQAETTDEETSSTWTRTRYEAATYRVTTSQNSHGESCWTRRVTRGSRDQSPVPEVLEVQKKRPATVSKTDTTLPYMRWQRPPFQRWYGPCTDSRPQPSRSTCRFVLCVIYNNIMHLIIIVHEPLHFILFIT